MDYWEYDNAAHLEHWFLEKKRKEDHKMFVAQAALHEFESIKPDRDE